MTTESSRNAAEVALDALEWLDGHFRRYLARTPTFNLDEALAESEHVLRANGRWVDARRPTETPHIPDKRHPSYTTCNCDSCKRERAAATRRAIEIQRGES